MKKAAAILLLIPYSILVTFVCAFVYGLFIVVNLIDGALTRPDGVVSAAAFVAAYAGMGSLIFTVPVSLIGIPLAGRLFPPRGSSAGSWTWHGAILGAAVFALAVVIILGPFYAWALSFSNTSSPGDFLNVLKLLGGAVPVGALTGALFGLTAHRLDRKPA